MDQVTRMQELERENARLREQVEQQEKELEELRKVKGNPPMIDMSAAETPSASMTNDPLPAGGLPPLTPMAIPQLSLQPEFQPKSGDQYHINDLLRYHDDQFVQNAYRAMLKRMPDAEEYHYYIESLRSGRFDKIDILARLRFSAEGKAKKVSIKGLMLPTRIRQVGRLPIFGYLVRLVVALVHLPIAIRNQQQFEVYSSMLHQQLADHINRISAQLINHSHEVSSVPIRMSKLGRVEEWGTEQGERMDRIEETVRGLGQGQGDLRRQLGLLGAHLREVEREREQGTKGLEKSIQELQEHTERWGAERDERVDEIEETVRGLKQGQRED